MATPKFLRLLTGRPTEAIAAAVGGVGSAEQVVSTNAAGTIDPTFFPAGIGADMIVVPASEALAAGNQVNLWTNAGATNARKADGSTVGKQSHGFVLAAVASGANATVYRSGQDTAVTGLTVGDAWLSATVPGGVQAAPPTGSGQTVQRVGQAITATLLDVQPGQDFVLA